MLATKDRKAVCQGASCGLIAWLSMKRIERAKPLTNETNFSSAGLQS
jgi:hypothetical protein